MVTWSCFCNTNQHQKSWAIKI